MSNQRVDLHVVESGQGTPLVLVHGYPLDHTIWEDVTRQIGEGIRVIRPDLRGYGQSPVTDGIYTMSLLADDLLGLLDRLRLERVVLAGHSMGGYVCLAFARAYPQRLAGLALVTTQAVADPPERREGRLAQALEVERRGTIAAVEAGLSKYSPDPVVLEKTREIMLRADPRAVAGSLRGMAERPDLSGLLPKLSLPALVIAGEVDELIPASRSEEMASLLPDGRMVVVKGGGHMAMMESPQVVAAALRELAGRAVMPGGKGDG